MKENDNVELKAELKLIKERLSVLDPSNNIEFQEFSRLTYRLEDITRMMKECKRPKLVLINGGK